MEEVQDQPVPSLEDRRQLLLDRLERWSEIPLTLLAIALVPILVGPYIWSLSPETEDTLSRLVYLIWGIFTVNLVIKVMISPHRLGYLRGHWLDVLLVILPMFRALHILRAFQPILAVVASGRVQAGLSRLFSRRGFSYTLLTALILVGVAATLVTMFERNEPGATIQTIPDGIWWAVTSVTTVGYGDAVPQSAGGRGVGIVLMLLGVAVFGVVTAQLAALFVEDQAQDADIAAQMRSLSQQLARQEDERAVWQQEMLQRLERIERDLLDQRAVQQHHDNDTGMND